MYFNKECPNTIVDGIAIVKILCILIKGCPNTIVEGKIEIIN